MRQQAKVKFLFGGGSQRRCRYERHCPCQMVALVAVGAQTKADTDAAQACPRGMAFYDSSSLGLCELHDASLVSLGAQLMILRQERAVDDRNGVGDGFVHAGSVLLGKPLSGDKSIADGTSGVAEPAVQLGNAVDSRKIEIGKSYDICWRT